MPKKDKQATPDAPQADAFDDFAVVEGGSATRYVQAVADRIIAFLTAKGDEVAASVAAGKLIALPVTIPVADLPAEDAAARSLKGNTAYDYLEAVKGAGHVYGTKWREEGDGDTKLLRLHLSKPRKTSKS